MLSFGIITLPLRVSLTKPPDPNGIGAPFSVPTPKIDSRYSPLSLTMDVISEMAEGSTPSEINNISAC